MRHRLPVLLCLCCGPATTACSSGASNGAPAPVVTHIDYNSTRDGPVQPKGEADPKAEPPDPSKCVHEWESVPRGTHDYQDPTSELPLLTLCTPVYCKKCGLVRHECQSRSKRR